MAKDNNRIDPVIDCQAANDGMTKQSFKDECDINYIVRKARQSGLLSHVNNKVGQYRDVANIPDYQTALDIVQQANDAFYSLDSKLRERFANDPGRMIEFVQTANEEDLINMGFIERKTETTDTPIS